MATTLNMTLLLRRAAFADSCVLQAGEPGYHITTKEFINSIADAVKAFIPEEMLDTRLKKFAIKL